MIEFGQRCCQAEMSQPLQPFTHCWSMEGSTSFTACDPRSYTSSHHTSDEGTPISEEAMSVDRYKSYLSLLLLSIEHGICHISPLDLACSSLGHDIREEDSLRHLELGHLLAHVVL